MQRQAETIRVAKELSKVVLLICGGSQSLDNYHDNRRSSFGRLLRRAENIAGHANSRAEGPSTPMQMAVTRDTFVQLMDDPVVLELLEDLEISISNKEKLFDIIDSNGNGSVDVSELIEGLMKLRGPADKGDAVSAALMVRQVQRDLRTLELEMHQWNRAIQADQALILQKLTPSDTSQKGTLLSMPQFQSMQRWTTPRVSAAG